MLRKVAFTMYPVKDMRAARAFYEETLGLGPSPSGATSPWVEFDLPGGGCFAITTVTPNEPSASAGGTIAFEVDDLPALVADLKAKGVAFAAEGIESPVCHMAVIKDPDGNAIILHKLKSAQQRAGN
jgi:predicted enzyme related to lactoylglutathione lyase